MLGLAPEQLKPLQEKRFLIVDDEVVNTKFFVHFFEDMELQLDVAHDGQQAVERVLAQPPDYYAAVLMDIRMPQMSGTDATLAIRSNAQWSELPIIAMSGNCQAQDRKHYLDCGMVDLLPKPAELKSIIQMLLKWVQPSASAGGTAEAIDGRQDETSPHSDQPSGLPLARQLKQRQQQLGMEQAGFNRLIQAFAASQQQSRQGLIKACQSQDHQQLQAWAHKLAGACANLGLMELRSSLKSLEQRSLPGCNWSELSADWSAVEQQLVELDQLIERYTDG